MTVTPMNCLSIDHADTADTQTLVCLHDWQTRRHPLNNGNVCVSANTPPRPPPERSVSECAAAMRVDNDADIPMRYARMSASPELRDGEQLWSQN
jgi:hypothetical protein